MPRQFAYDVSPTFNLGSTPGVGAANHRIDRYLHPPTLAVRGDFGAGPGVLSVEIAAKRSEAAADAVVFTTISADSVIQLPVGYTVFLTVDPNVVDIEIDVAGIAFSPWTDFTVSGPT